MMRQHRRGFAMADATACVVIVGICGVMAGMSGPPLGLRLARSFDNLRRIGEAGEMHRADNKGKLPLTPTYWGRPGPKQKASGWCTWSAGGKNNDRYWVKAYGGLFDVEAADRPLNQYTQPGYTYYAPPIPKSLPADHPAREQDQAKTFRDPMDDATRQQEWPEETPTISGYDDVGTSYHWNAAWMLQMSNGDPIAKRFEIGQQRFASGDGVDPKRFAWMSDDELEVVVATLNRDAEVTDNYGNVNTSQMLFIDGHVGYRPTIPGHIQSSYDNENYTLIFSDLPNPGLPD